jgi:transposase
MTLPGLARPSPSIPTGALPVAKLLLPDEVWDAVRPLLPPRPPSVKGGRPRLDDRRALTGVLFVLRTGVPWDKLPGELGCGSGMTCWRRLAEWQAAGAWAAVERVLAARLPGGDQFDWARAAVDGYEPNGNHSRKPTPSPCPPGRR